MLTFFTLFDVRMIQISTFPAAPSTERVPSLAERVASLRYSINLRFLNNRVPALLVMWFFWNQESQSVSAISISMSILAPSCTFWFIPTSHCQHLFSASSYQPCSTWFSIEISQQLLLNMRCNGGRLSVVESLKGCRTFPGHWRG